MNPIVNLISKKESNSKFNLEMDLDCKFKNGFQL